MYTVIESEDQVEVCVNLTHPPEDIFDATVRVNVFKNESTVYIPDGAIIASMLNLRSAEVASMLNLHVSDRVAQVKLQYFFQPRMFLIVIRESTLWLHWLTMKSRRGVEIALGTQLSMQQEGLSAMTNLSTMMSV